MVRLRVGKMQAQQGTPVPRLPSRRGFRWTISKAIASYANFCRVTGTPEELIIDFGLNSSPSGFPPNPSPLLSGL